ncbi:unnamed protein product [Meganyctiphanes norvegica]|uniref:Uncharacterized protein n=1 Tax=Meganyctiphanes norvegica TaxID=48144 RepID=A0AAV2QY50_MEGNR
METHQQLCLHWKDFHTNISTEFVSLREDEEFVDITLACDGKQVKAHKMVLSACSLYFKRLLKGNPCQHPIVFLKDVTFAYLEYLLDFMYHGEVNVPHTELAKFIKIADALGIKGLAQDEKIKESESYIEACSPLSTRDPPTPELVHLREEVINAPDKHTTEFPLPKRLKRHSREGSRELSHTIEQSIEIIQSENKEYSVKNASLDLNDDSPDSLICCDTKNIKHDIDSIDEGEFIPCESESINQNQSAMQQLQKPFESFLHPMNQIPCGTNFMPRPVFLPERGHDLIPRNVALPGPSMSQGATSLDASQDGDGRLECPHCGKFYSQYSLKQHIEDIHTVHLSTYECNFCQKHYKTPHSLKVHVSKYHMNQQRAKPLGSK